MINKLKKYVEKDYVVTIITKDKTDIMYVNAISKKNAIEKVSDVILNSSLYNIESLDNVKLKCRKKEKLTYNLIKSQMYDL